MQWNGTSSYIVSKSQATLHTYKILNPCREKCWLRVMPMRLFAIPIPLYPFPFNQSRKKPPLQISSKRFWFIGNKLFSINPLFFIHKGPICSNRNFYSLSFLSKNCYLIVTIKRTWANWILLNLKANSSGC